MELATYLISYYTPENVIIECNICRNKLFYCFVADPNVKAILVNVFGGIVNCATIANGIISASHNLKLNIPLIVRLEGEN
jgi:succinyl-CoA synthetase beta subunit